MSYEPWRQTWTRRLDDPCPPNGVGEALYCTLKARFGYWSPTFLRYVNTVYGGKIPNRFLSLVAKLERERPWELPADPTAGLPPTITIVDRRGKQVARWRPSAAEWAEAGRAAAELRR